MIMLATEDFHPDLAFSVLTQISSIVDDSEFSALLDLTHLADRFDPSLCFFHALYFNSETISRSLSNERSFVQGQ